jgi:hypothetical protein
MSGLNYVHNIDDYKFHFLMNFLFGNLSSGPMLKLASRIDRLVIAGNIYKEEEDLEKILVGSYRMIDKMNKVYETFKSSITKLDSILSEVVKNIAVDLMPGFNDPTSNLLP